MRRNKKGFHINFDRREKWCIHLIYKIQLQLKAWMVSIRIAGILSENLSKCILQQKILKSKLFMQGTLTFQLSHDTQHSALCMHYFDERFYELKSRWHLKYKILWVDQNLKRSHNARCTNIRQILWKDLDEKLK